MTLDKYSFKVFYVILSGRLIIFFLQVNPCKHPIVILKDVSHHELSYMLEFMYKGEVGVRHEELPSFLKLAETLKVKGLAGEKIEVSYFFMVLLKILLHYDFFKMIQVNQNNIYLSVLCFRMKIIASYPENEQQLLGSGKKRCPYLAQILKVLKLN